MIMTTKEVAARLQKLSQTGDFEKAQQELFSADATSTEPEASAGFEKETKGLPAIIEKGHQFNSMVEAIHGIKVSEPLVIGNVFALTLDIDVTMKGQSRSNMSELCVYQVKNGKIVAEQFFM
jgi:hypothetical protein